MPTHVWNQGHDSRCTDISWRPHLSESIQWGPQAGLPGIANARASSLAQILMKSVESKVTVHFIVDDYHEDLSDFLWEPGNM